MKTIANVLWFIFGGLFSAIAYFIFGVLLCITIIGIPFGLQLFKVSRLMLWPFGTKVNIRFLSHPIANTLWVVFFGWGLFVMNFISVIALFCGIVTIPFAFQVFKMAKISFAPFGSQIIG